MNMTKKTALDAENSFANALCNSVSMFDQQNQNDFQINDNSLIYVRGIIESANAYFASIGESVQQATLSYLTKDNAIDELKLTFMKFLKQVSGNEVKNLTEALTLFRKHRRKVYKTSNWKKFLLGEYSYHRVALEELYLALFFYFSGDLKRSDLSQYERWHGFSLGGIVTEGPIQRLVDSFKTQWLRISKLGY